MKARRPQASKRDRARRRLERLAGEHVYRYVVNARPEEVAR